MNTGKDPKASRLRPVSTDLVDGAAVGLDDALGRAGDALF